MKTQLWDHYSLRCARLCVVRVCVSVMSDVPDEVKKSFAKLADEITCPVCQEFFQEPKILPCFHYYCKQCVVRIHKAAPAKEHAFLCPECREPTLLPEDKGVDGLPTAFFVNRMKSLHDAMKKAQEASVTLDLLCEECKSDKAVAFCRHCAHYICQYCREGHRRMKVLSGHSVVSIEDVRKSIADSEIVSPILPPEPMACKEHQEQLRMYCYECSQLVCRDCLLLNHKDHYSEMVKDCAVKCKMALSDYLECLQHTQRQLKHAREPFEGIAKKISSRKTDLEQEINSSFDEILKILDHHRSELLATVQSKVDDKLTSLEGQEKELKLCEAGVQGLKEFIEQSLENASDQEIVSIRKQLQNRVRDEISKCKKLDTVPCVTTANEIEVDISFISEIEEVFQEKAIIRSLTNRLQIEEMETGKQSKIIVCSEATQFDPSITVELKQVAEGSVASTNVTTEGNKISIACRPDVRGRHKLSVLINQKHIAGSPFNVFVKHPPTQLLSPTRILHNISNPYAITLKKSGQLFVTQLGKSLGSGMGSVIALSTSGRVIPGGIKGPTWPYGVAVDKDGAVLVTSGNNEQLVKYNKKWTTEFGGKGSQLRSFKHIGRVRVSPNNQYYVCDRKNHRVHVINQDMKGAYTFGKHGKDLGELCYPTDVAFDSDANIYVVDCFNNRIQKFNSDERPLFSFGKQGSGPGELSHPKGIHISGDFVYVTEQDNHRVSVFTVSGEFVTSFGNAGELDSPQGITEDEDGFLYICSENSNRIVVY